jgi:hypothetical protein
MSQYFNLLPSNQPSNNVIKFEGVPLINFTFAQNPNATVQGSSIRLNGKLKCKASNGGVIADGTANLDERLGVYSLLDRLSVSLLSNSQIIEEIKFYNSFLSSYLSVTSSEQQILTSDNVQRGSVMSQGQGSDIVVNGTGAGQSEMFFSLQLPCGLFLGQNPIPLIHGLVISLNLCPPSQAFRADSGTAPYYELSDVHLSGRMMTGIQNVPRTLVYNSIQSYYSVINSAFATLNFNLGTSQTLGAWVVFRPSENTNNYQKSGTRNLPIMNSSTAPAVIKDLQFLQNGVKIQLQYPIEDDVAEDQTLFNSQITRNFISAIRNFASLGNSGVSPINTNLEQSFADEHDKVKGDFVYGVGLRMDYYSDQGVNMVGGNFTVQFTSTLQEDFPNSAYMFVHTRNTLNFDDVGVQVLN